MRRAGIAVLLALVVAVGFRWKSFVAGGSDSYCYLHQAERWASGRLQVPEPLALEAPWPNAPLTFAPAGHLPSPTVPGAIVPICPAGLSMVMAIVITLGGLGAAALVVPIFGAILIWDELDPAWLDRAIAFVRSRGFEPFLLFESREEPLFRRRFAAESAVGRLDWPPAAEIVSQVRVYRPDDRGRYLRGVQPPTEYVR